MVDSKRLNWVRSACDWLDAADETSLIYASDERMVYVENNAVFAQQTAFFGHGSAIYAGRYSNMLDGGFISPMLTIGRHCSISQNVVLGGGAHHMDYLTTGIIPGEDHDDDYFSPAEERYRTGDISAFTRIGCDVWIGANATVLRGRTVGTGACIGAGCVVNHDVPPYAIVVGNPARVIRYRFSETIIESLLRTRWWTLPPEIIKSLPYKDIERCVDVLAEIREQ
ncbi:putative acetyltransferase [Candidatus Terasakiella magnetica]|nr:putative acetyltransferase [Candidatus Terasakiella magnetica]